MYDEAVILGHVTRIMAGNGRPFRHTALKTFSGRTQEGAFLRGVREELTCHVGGRPDAAQAQIIDQIARLRLRLLMLDKQTAATGSAGDMTAYVSLAANVARLMDRLGGPGEPTAPSIVDLVQSAAGTRRRTARAAQDDDEADGVTCVFCTAADETALAGVQAAAAGEVAA